MDFYQKSLCTQEVISYFVAVVIVITERIAIVDMFAGREKKIGQNIGEKGSLCAYQEGDRRQKIDRRTNK